MFPFGKRLERSNLTTLMCKLFKQKKKKKTNGKVMKSLTTYPILDDAFISLTDCLLSTTATF
jgi:hypothetical protein